MKKTVIVERRTATGRVKREIITVDNKGFSGEKPTILKKRDISGEPANVHAFFNKLQHA